MISGLCCYRLCQFSSVLHFIIGLVLGFLLSKTVEIIAQITLNTQLLRADFSLTLILGSLLFSFVVGSISGVAPAYQASKLHPVEALRK